MTDYTLREFNLERDYDAVLVLWSTVGPGVHVGPSDSRDAIARKLERDPDLFLVAESDGRLVGSVIGGWDGRRGIVYHLAVDVEYRRQGVGLALMSELELRLRVRGCRRAWLLVHPDNESAIAFYESLGWEKMPIQAMGKRIEETAA